MQRLYVFWFVITKKFLLHLLQTLKSPQPPLKTAVYTHFGSIPLNPPLNWGTLTPIPALQRGARGDQNVMKQTWKTCVYTVVLKKGGLYVSNYEVKYFYQTDNS